MKQSDQLETKDAATATPRVASSDVVCDGIELATCPDCNGTGNVLVMDCEGRMQAQCPCCLGTKRLRFIGSRSHTDKDHATDGARDENQPKKSK